MTHMKGSKYKRDGATAAADVGLNADIVYAAGSSPNYVSKVELMILI